MFEEIRSEKSRDCRNVIVVDKPRFHNVFRQHQNVKEVFTGLKNAFVKLRACLLWTAGLKVDFNFLRTANFSGSVDGASLVADVLFLVFTLVRQHQEKEYLLAGKDAQGMK